MMGPAVIFAHQGGWDEALLLVVPVALFAGLLWVATRRAAAHGDGPGAESLREHP